MKKRIPLFLSCICLLMLTACGQTSIDTQNIATVTFSGIDTHGTVAIEPNHDINETIDPQKVVNYINKVSDVDTLYSEDSILEDGIFPLLSYEFDKTSNLSNGDTITMTISPSAEMEMVGQSLEDIQKGVGFKLSENPVEITVSGLEEVAIIDLSEELAEHITYNGADGEATPVFDGENFSISKDGVQFTGAGQNFKGKSETADGGDIQFTMTFDPDYDLTTGDTLTVRLNYNQDSAAKQGFTVNNEFTITVPGLPTYVSSPDQITEDMKNDVIEYMFNDIKTDIQHDFYDTFTLLDAKWCDRKNNAPDKGAAEEYYLAIRYSYQYNNFFSIKEDETNAVCNILLYPDGTYEFSEVKYGEISTQYDCTTLDWNLSSYNA